MDSGKITMRSPVYALVWEQWRQVRALIALALLLTFAASWTVHHVIEIAVQFEPNFPWTQTDSRNWAEISTVLAGIALVLVMTALLFTHSSVRDLRMGVPPRMLTLPVSPMRIALTQIVFRFVTVGLVALIIGLSLTLIDALYGELILPVVGVSLLCYAYASAIATTIGKRSAVAAVVTIILTISPVIATLLEIQSAISTQVRPANAVLFVFVVACAVLSVLSLARLRNVLPVQIVVIPRQGSPNYARQRNTDSAMFTYEWRRLAWIFPSFAAGSALALIVPFMLLAPRRFVSELVGEYVTGVFLFSPPLVAFIVGMILIAREHRDSVTGVARFAWTRPVTVQQVILRRMKAVTLSILLTYAGLGLVTLIPLYFSGELNHVDAEEAAVGVACYFGILLGAWCIVWAPYVPIAYWLVCSIYISRKIDTGTWGPHDDLFLLWIPQAIFLIALILLARSCFRRKIFQPGVIISAGLFCTALVTISLPMYYIFSEEVSWTRQYIPTAITLSLMPLFVLLSQGIFLDKVRHNALFRKLPPRIP